MPVIMTGLLDTESLILRLESSAKKRVVKTLVNNAHAIQALAIKMAPVDVGNLEKAIKVRGDDGTRARDLETGTFLRTEVEVYVDGTMSAANGKMVGDYAYEIHEHLSPVGGHKLGKKSQEKQSGNGGVIVGGGFLERAAIQMDLLLEAQILESLNDDL